MTGIFYPSGHATQLVEYKIFSKKLFEGLKKINTVLKISIFTKMTKIWPRTPSFGPVQASIASPILVCW